jgi:FkbM family methyltransferase
LGLEVHRTRTELTQHDQRRLLFSRLGITLVLDVGANVGQYAGTYLRRWTAYAGRIASFEPLPASYSRCASVATADPLWDVYPFGLSDAPGTVPIFVPDGQSELSSLHPLTRFGSRLLEGNPLTSATVEVRRLDDVIAELARDDEVLALKLDVQGHEAAVLAGGTATLKHVTFIECELPLVSLYDGQAGFESMLGTFREMGFTPVGLYANYVDPVSGYAIDSDVFFVRSDRP